MNEKPMLKPCPFCGSPKPVVYPAEDGRNYYVWCPACTSFGPRFGVELEDAVDAAIAAWNVRPFCE